MKKFYLLILVIIGISASAQPKLDSLKRQWFMVKTDSTKFELPLATKFENCTFSNPKKTEKGKIEAGIFYLEDYILCRNGADRKFIYKINNGVQSYFVDVNEVSFISKEKSSDEAMVFFSTLQPDEKILYQNELNNFITEFQEYRNDMAAEEEEEPIRESISEMLKNPLVIYDYAFTSNYSIGFRIEILNTSKKRIKYLSFNVSGFNEVDDRVPTYRGEYSRSLRGVGPVEVNGSGSWEFETIWSDNSFYSGRINSITVEYFDGSKRTFTKVGSLVFSDEERDLFDKVSRSE